MSQRSLTMIDEPSAAEWTKSEQLNVERDWSEEATDRIFNLYFIWINDSANDYELWLDCSRN